MPVISPSGQLRSFVTSTASHVHVEETSICALAIRLYAVVRFIAGCTVVIVGDARTLLRCQCWVNPSLKVSRSLFSCTCFPLCNLMVSNNSFSRAGQCVSFSLSLSGTQQSLSGLDKRIPRDRSRHLKNASNEAEKKQAEAKADRLGREKKVIRSSRYQSQVCISLSLSLSLSLSIHVSNYTSFSRLLCWNSTHRWMPRLQRKASIGTAMPRNPLERRVAPSPRH
jgi:hypothetical protein